MVKQPTVYILASSKNGTISTIRLPFWIPAFAGMTNQNVKRDRIYEMDY